MDVRDLREDADGTDDGERCGQNAVRNGGHEVAATRRDLVHHRRQFQAVTAHPGKLGGGEPVRMNHAACALHAHHDLVGLGGGREHRGDLQPQVVDRTRLDVAVEVQHEDAPALVLRLVATLAFELPRLRFALALFLGGGVRNGRLFDHPAHVAQAFVEQRDLDVTSRRFAHRPVGAGRRHGGQHDQRGDDNRGRLGEEAKVLEQEIHGG